MPSFVKPTSQPKHPVTVLTETELVRLLEAPFKTKEKEIIKLRDRAILEMLFSTGLKISELVNLKRDQVNLNNESFDVFNNKHIKRTVSLSHQTRYYLKQYLEKRTDTFNSLFTSHDRAQKARGNISASITPRSIQRGLEYYKKLIGLKNKITPSLLRHSFAFNLLKNGMDIKTVSLMLGHSNISTTKLYAYN
jgi:site-specific recombinase XerD